MCSFSMGFIMILRAIISTDHFTNLQDNFIYDDDKGFKFEILTVQLNVVIQMIFGYLLAFKNCKLRIG